MRRIMKTGWLLACLCLSFSVAAQTAAKVLFTSGDVIAKRGGKIRKLSRGENLSVGDVVETSASAEARLRYTNGSLVTLSKKASYQILKYTPKQNVEIEAKLNRGQAKIVTEGNQSKREVLKTQVVAMAILGTNVTVDTGIGNTLEVKLVEGGPVNIGDVSISSPGVYNITTDENGNPVIRTEGGQEVSTQSEQSTIEIESAETNVEDIGQLITTAAVSEGATSASVQPGPTLQILCP